MSGCGSSTANPNATSSAEGGHPAGWLPAGHKAAAEEDINVCAECHGSTYDGGIAGVSCTLCHLGDKDHVHPLEWGSQVTTTHGAYVGNNGSTACANANCHGTDLSGVTGSGLSCSSCHLGGNGSVHPLRWGSNVTLYHRWYAFHNGTTACSNASCHGTTLTGVAQSGPDCGTCHALTPTAATCTGCHDFPPATGQHSVHTSKQDVDCSVCHQGNHAFTTGKAHTGPVHMSFLSLFTAKSGTIVSYSTSSNTCSKVSCHGGQTTPSWTTGTLDVATQCTSCHSLGTSAGNPEYNSYYSGQHEVHVVEEGKACTVCHDNTKLATNHFTNLNTPVMEGPASATINDTLHYDGVSCTPACHNTRSWK